MRKVIAEVQRTIRRCICAVRGHRPRRGTWFREIDGFLHWGPEICCTRCGRREPA